MNIESICHSFSSNINSLLNQIIVSPTANSRRQGKKGLEYQTLEPRCLLSATAPEFASADMFVNEVHKPLRSDEVQGLVVDVNGRMLNLTQSDNVLQLVPGDHFSVADIAFHSSSKQGVFAAEGYVNKLADKQNASTTDYADGRFSLREDNQAATGSYGSIAGLNDGWTVEAGWDRLTVVLIHYTESNTDVFDRFVVDLRVDQPDLAFSTDVLDQISSQKVFVGDQVEIPGAWSNVGDGLYHNYAEVDIYHRSDMDRIVWAGALYGNVGDGTSVDGSFINEKSKGFSDLWSPTMEGEYVLKYYLDPEAVLSETVETNNFHEVRLVVDAVPPPTAVADHFDSNLESLDVLANDTSESGGRISVDEFSQPTNGSVTLNKDGTLNYTPNKGFYGVDEFNYSVSDGDQISKLATVTVERVRPFEAVTSVTGFENAPIAIEIQTEFDAVLITSFPKDAYLSTGDKIGAKKYEVAASELTDLQIIPNSEFDGDFELKVTPIHQGEKLKQWTTKIQVSIEQSADIDVKDDVFEENDWSSSEWSSWFGNDWFGGDSGFDGRDFDFPGWSGSGLSDGDFVGRSFKGKDLRNLDLRSDSADEIVEWLFGI